jgi:hypothetical protein
LFVPHFGGLTLSFHFFMMSDIPAVPLTAEEFVATINPPRFQFAASTVAVPPGMSESLASASSTVENTQQQMCQGQIKDDQQSRPFLVFKLASQMSFEGDEGGSSIKYLEALDSVSINMGLSPAEQFQLLTFSLKGDAYLQVAMIPSSLPVEVKLERLRSGLLSRYRLDRFTMLQRLTTNGIADYSGVGEYICSTHHLAKSAFPELDDNSLDAVIKSFIILGLGEVSDPRVSVLRSKVSDELPKLLEEIRLSFPETDKPVKVACTTTVSSKQSHHPHHQNHRSNNTNKSSNNKTANKVIDKKRSKDKGSDKPAQFCEFCRRNNHSTANCRLLAKAQSFKTKEVISVGCPEGLPLISSSLGLALIDTGASEVIRCDKLNNNHVHSDSEHGIVSIKSR